MDTTLKMSILLIFISFSVVQQASGTVCNEAICASIVSKCTLLKSCECEIDPENGSCPCCKKCYSCLEHLAWECCSCVGLCPSKNETEVESLTTKSIIGDIANPTPQLWDALMEGEDPKDLWDKLTFEVNRNDFKTPETLQETVVQPDYVTFNCTVAFLRNEIGDRKCEKSCMSMGATSYRWFTNGCCQCVGHGCLNHGVNESRCGFVQDTDAQEDESEDDYLELSDEELKLLEEEYGITDQDYFAGGK